MSIEDNGIATPIEDSPAGNYFVSAYPPFGCWNEGAVDAFREALQRPWSPEPDPGLGLYVHIPFCAHRCRYCYYLSYDDRADAMSPYLGALGREHERYAATPALRDRPLSFVYFGGGTPSLLSASRLEELFRGLKRAWSWAAVEEVTFECAPRTVTEQKLEILRVAGVTRLSLGVQHFDDEILAQNGRVHLVHDVERAYAAARRADFEVVNIDLIVGLLGETDRTLDHTLDRTIELAPDSVTIYPLELPLNTPLYRSWRDDALEGTLPDWEIKRERLGRAFARLEQAGYTVRSAYAAVRDPRRHRFVYQDDQYRGVDLLGVGVSSFSYLDGVHHQNRASLQRYIEQVDSGDLPLWRAYRLSREERAVREFILQLKLGRVDTRALLRKHGVDVMERSLDALRAFERRGWLRREPDGVELTRDGLLRADLMLPAFYLPAHRGVRYS